MEVPIGPIAWNIPIIKLNTGWIFSTLIQVAPEQELAPETTLEMAEVLSHPNNLVKKHLEQQ